MYSLLFRLSDPPHHLLGLSSFDWTFNGTATGGFTWSTYDSQTFIGAEVFALLNFITLLVFAVILVVLQSGVSDQLGINDGERRCRLI